MDWYDEATKLPDGYENWLDFARNAPPEEKEARKVRVAEAEAVKRAEREAADAETAAKFAYGLSDEGLQASIEHGDLGIRYGVHPRQARELLRLETVEQRKRAMGEAHTISNLQGGVFSGSLWQAVNQMLANIAAGDPDKELWAEGAARRHREAEAAANKGNYGPRVILYPPEMRRA